MSGDALIAAAARIGDLVLARGEHGPRGLCWPVPRRSADPEAAAGGVVAWENVYSGAAGIALFLIELYRTTGGDRFLHAAGEALEWAAWRAATEPGLNDSYLSGRTGIAAALVRLGEVASRPLLGRAVGVALAAGDQAGAPGPQFDWLGGAAGTMWGMCNLYGATRDRRCLERAERELERLVGAAVVGRNGGLGWLEAETGADALCGFSHGSSGVAYALAELGSWARRPGAEWLADLAFRHEDQYFVPEWGNWRDLRQGWTPEDVREAVAAYRGGDPAYFTRGADTTAWCHGAPGIALARLRAWEVAGADRHLDAAKVALATTERWLRSEHARASEGLCHGRCGNASALIEASRVLLDDSLLGTPRWIAGELAEATLAEPDAGGFRWPHSGLFTGAAGTGYFLLEAADPLGTPSMLAPRLARGHVPGAWAPRALDRPEWVVARSGWPCITRVFEARTDDPAGRLAAAAAPGNDLRECVRALVARESDDRPETRRLREAWEFDRACERLHEGRLSNSHTLVEAFVAETDARAALDEGADLDTLVRWSPQVDLRFERWPWELVRAGEPADLDAPADRVLLLRRTPGAVSVRRLGAAEAVLFELARPGARIEEVLSGAEARGLDAAVADLLAALLLRGELVLVPPAGCEIARDA